MAIHAVGRPQTKSRSQAAPRSRKAACALPRDRYIPGQKLDLTPDGARVGAQMPVKVKKGAFTVCGTAVITQMDDRITSFVINIRDRVWGKKVEKDIAVTVTQKSDGQYTIRKEEGNEVEEGDVQAVKVEGRVTKLQVPDPREDGHPTEIQFHDLGDGRFKIRGEDFSAEFNARGSV